MWWTVAWIWNGNCICHRVANRILICDSFRMRATSYHFSVIDASIGGLPRRDTTLCRLSIRRSATWPPTQWTFQSYHCGPWATWCYTTPWTEDIRHLWRCSWPPHIWWYLRMASCWISSSAFSESKGACGSFRLWTFRHPKPPHATILNISHHWHWSAVITHITSHYSHIL